MKNGANIYRILAAALLVAMVLNCSFIKREPPLEQTPETPESAVKAQHDPLSLPQDTIVITQPEKRATALTEHAAAPSDEESTTNGVSRISGEAVSGAESSNSQVYRVQLLTFNAYGEGRREFAVAEEIFDQQVFLDYDVPYYKLRVGQFATREAAERYLQRVRTAGYPNALVVIATIGAKEAASLYQTTSARPDRPPQKPADTSHVDHN